MWRFSILLLCSGCYGQAVDGIGTRVIHDGTETPSLRDTRVALDTFAAMHDGKVEDNLAVLGRVTIVYTTGSLDEYSPAPDLEVTGYEYGYEVVVLSDKQHSSAKTSSLVHELEHVMLWDRYRNPENEHTGRWTPETYSWINKTMSLMESE